jgi:hypothetical protein
MSDELSQKYRHIFLSPLGLEVLVDILQDCHFGCTLDPDNKVQIAEYNVGITILAKCGVFGPDRDVPVMNAMINSLQSSKPKEE